MMISLASVAVSQRLESMSACPEPEGGTRHLNVISQQIVGIGCLNSTRLVESQWEAILIVAILPRS